MNPKLRSPKSKITTTTTRRGYISRIPSSATRGMQPFSCRRKLSSSACFHRPFSFCLVVGKISNDRAGTGPCLHPWKQFSHNSGATIITITVPIAPTAVPQHVPRRTSKQSNPLKTSKNTTHLPLIHTVRASDSMPRLVISVVRHDTCTKSGDGPST